MEPELADNPFAALFPTLVQAESFTAISKPHLQFQLGSGGPRNAESEEVSAKQTLQTNNTIENVFLITTDKEPHGQGRPSCCVYLNDLWQNQQDWIDVETLPQAVFERLMLTNPSDSLISTHGTGTVEDSNLAQLAGQTQVLVYLFDCFRRYKHSDYTKKVSKELAGAISDVILKNCVLCLQHPDIFPETDPSEQIISIFIDNYDSRDAELMHKFLGWVADGVKQNSDEGSVLECFKGVLNIACNKIGNSSLGHSDSVVHAQLVKSFTTVSSLGTALVDYMEPADWSKGSSYETTLLGTMLRQSCLPKLDTGPFEFFDSPSRNSKQEHDAVESHIHQTMRVVNEYAYQIIYNLLRLNESIRSSMLSWLARCLAANKGRSKMWSQQMGDLMGPLYCSDGFFINLCVVLLRLCEPLSQPRSQKLLRVQPTYCLATNADARKRQAVSVHMTDLGKETSLVPRDEEESAVRLDKSYSFVTECFFITHMTLHVGLNTVIEKFMRLNQTLHRIQGAWRDINAQGAENSEPGQRIKEQMERGMSHFLCIKAALTETGLLETCFKFLTATCTYLVQVATSDNLTSWEAVNFPLPDTVPAPLSYLPEMVAENVLDFLLFLRRFKESFFATAEDNLEYVMTFVIVFMGSPNRMSNPHTRARMAEVLEALMPPKGIQQASLLNSSILREKLFTSHPLATHLAETLLRVFVSIEMTGHGVQFEQKFNYRRPMYRVLDHLWTIPQHRKSMQDMAQSAEEHVEDADAPLFLRFVNLLINDAIYLLDEALSFMVQIKELQVERDRGDWKVLTPPQRQEKESGLQQLSMMARHHNMMGMDTIHTLALLTSCITNIFAHPVIVHRISAMLNYFLQHLVGPKQKNLKVKDFDECEFKPQQLVREICQIYNNLGQSDSFCQAVSADGRSYSHKLFQQATQVLHRIHSPHNEIVEFTELAERIKVVAAEMESQDEAIEDVPESFVDPIMGSVMSDPVTLPSSGMTVDRATIARHILSDQSDPFNRQPLTMDMVIPNLELKQQIADWRAGGRATSKVPSGIATE